MIAAVLVHANEMEGSLRAPLLEKGLARKTEQSLGSMKPNHPPLVDVKGWASSGTCVLSLRQSRTRRRSLMLWEMSNDFCPVEASIAGGSISRGVSGSSRSTASIFEEDELIG